MNIITQITPDGKRLQLDSETYTEINQRTGFVTIHEGQRTGDMSDWGGRCIGYLSLAQAIEVVKAALDADDEARFAEMIQQWETAQDAKADATSAHFGHD